MYRFLILKQKNLPSSRSLNTVMLLGPFNLSSKRACFPTNAEAEEEAMCIICSWKCRTSSISNRRGCLLKKKKLIQEVNEISIFQGAFLCTAGRGAGLRACAANVASSVFAGVFSVGGPPKLKGVGLDVTAAAAAGRGLPGCLRGQGELPGAWFGGAACAS